MTDIDMSAPVLVTGATGYVAGWIVKALLEAGATVHAPVRDPDRAEKLAALRAIEAETPGTLKFFKADLLDPGSYDAAMDGCRVVFHTASPFTLAVKDPQKELVDPAVKGTRNVLESANRCDSVTRVVVTSSVVAMYTDNVDLAVLPGGRLTEAAWNSTASLDYQPYALSKTLAEKAAWEMAEAQTRWRMVTINPSFVLGPAIGGAPTSESFEIMGRLVKGEMKAGAPRLGMGVIDVRDLAQAHLAAGFVPGAEGRHIISGHETDLFEALALLAPRFGDRVGVPKRAVPKPILWLFGPLMGLPRRMVSGSVGVPWRADTSKAVQSLGLAPRPLRETMEDMLEFMLAAKAR